jgi:acyl dehydratase
MLDRYLEDYAQGEVIRGGGITITDGDIIDFALRYDPQPFHLDGRAAARSIYGGLIASGWQVGALGFRSLVQQGLLGRGSLGSPGLDEIRWLKPVRPGDTLYGVAEILEVRPSRSRPDRGIVRVAYRVENQAGETVMSFIGNQLVARRPAE